MSLHALKDTKEKAASKASNPKGLTKDNEASLAFSDNRPQQMALQNQIGGVNASSQVKQLFKYQSKADQFTENKTASLTKLMGNQKQSGPAAIQRKENGLPSALRSGVEQLSGMSMGDVKVHRNSDKPAQLQAHAYAQGTDIHLGPGQEKHLPHEAWHVVQQKQGRVAPTVQMKGQVAINDSQHLEKEADTLGAKAQKLGMNPEVGNQGGVAQRMGMGEEVVQGKFALGKVAQLAKPTKMEIAGGLAEESVELVSTASDVSGFVGDTMGEMSGDGSMVNLLKGEESESVASQGVGLDSDAQGIANQVFGGLTSLADLIEKGSKLWQKKDWETGADFMISAAESANYVIETLASHDAMGEIPLLGPAIAGFKTGLEIFRNNRSLKTLRQVEKGLTLEPKEKETLEKYVGKIKVQLASGAVDFALILAKAVGDFFPPVGQAISIVKGVKGLFEKGYDTWKSYKAGKEKQAVARLTGGDEGLSDEQQDEFAGLSKKVNRDGETPGLRQGGTLLDLVNLQAEIKDKEIEANAAIAPQQNDLFTELATMKANLMTSIAEYNTAMSLVDDSKITEADVQSLEEHHANCINTVLKQVATENGMLSMFRRGLGKISDSALPDKEKIIKDVWKGAPLPDKLNTTELSKGKYSGYFWGKTKKALQDASKGRTHFTKEELGESMKAILEKYKAKGLVTEDQINLIVRD
jgi:hypothetical protein